MPKDLPDWQRSSGGPAQLGNVVAQPGLTNSASFSVPFGSVAIGFQVDFSGANGNPTLVQVTGDQSNINFLNVAFPPGGGPQVAVLGTQDTSVTLRVTAPGGTTSSVNLMAWAGSVPPTVSPGASAPLWQAPRQIVYAEGAAVGTFQMLAGAVGQTIRIWGWELQVDGGGAGATTAFMEDDTTVGVTARKAFIGAPGGGPTSISGNLQGGPLDASGHGLRLNIAIIGAVATTVRAAASVSQG